MEKPKAPEIQETWHNSERAIRGRGRLAVHTAFEHEMQEADERLITREEAIQRMRRLATEGYMDDAA